MGAARYGRDVLCARRIATGLRTARIASVPGPSGSSFHDDRGRERPAPHTWERPQLSPNTHRAVATAQSPRPQGEMNR